MSSAAIRSAVLARAVSSLSALDGVDAGTADEVVSHLQICIAGLAESANRTCRGETIYASRLSVEALHHLLIADDLMSNRAPLGASKRESVVPGPLTELAKSHLAVTSVDARQYFSDLSSATVDLVNKALARGFCSDAAAIRLAAALQQLTLLAAGK